MVSFISKFLFTATVTAPTFLSLGLIGVIIGVPLKWDELNN